MKKSVDELAIEFMRSNYDQMDLMRAFKSGYLAGFSDAKEAAVNFLSAVAQGICEQVNMGDSTISEIRPELKRIDYIIKTIQLLNPESKESEL